jgi:hypothetical protein
VGGHAGAGERAQNLVGGLSSNLSILICDIVGFPSESKIFQNPAKPRQAQPKEIKEKGSDFLGFSCPN